jgi:hypothetical protein
LQQSPFRAVSIEHTAAPLPTKAGNPFVYAEKNAVMTLGREKLIL